MKWIFWSSVAVILYSYLLYPTLLFVLSVLHNAWRQLLFLVLRTKRRKGDEAGFAPEDWPKISFILAAHNEEGLIQKKIRNALSAEYPADRIEFLVGSDASTDQTVPLAREIGDDRVRVFDYRERSGKIGVLRKLVEEARGQILVLSDANTFFEPESIKALVRHFANPHVGAVCGELRLTAPDGTLQSEGLYWRYETAIKTLENQFGAVLGANGGNYAVRKDLFPSIPRDTIVEDFVIPLLIRSQGFQTPFEPEALALESNPVDPKAEFRRRVRIGAGCIQSIPILSKLLSPSLGMVSLAFWSHKILRWCVPICMVIALLSSLVLFGEPVYRGMLIAQICFYGLAVMVHFSGKRGGITSLPYLFVSLNTALAFGYVSFLRGKHRVAWNPTARGASA